MDNNEISNQSKKESKNEIKKESKNSLREFKIDNKEQISLSHNEIKKDKNEIIPLLSEYKEGDKNERVPISTESKSNDKIKIIPLPSESKEDDKNKIIPLSIESKSKDKNEIIPSPFECKEENKKVDNNIIQNNCAPKNNNINISLNQPSLKVDNNNTFPKGTIYEEQLNQYFQYFNIFWYDPDNTNDHKLFKKCFEKVEFYRKNDFFSAINFFKKELISEWIVITPGSQGEELIMNLENFECIKYFFIYCQNTEIHENWTKKYKKIVCLTSDPEILCLKLFEVNDYFIPNFNYKSEENNDLLNPNKNSLMNKYNKLCIKIINYIEGNEIKNDMKEASTENNSFLYLAADYLGGFKQSIYQIGIPLVKNLTLLSLYFNQYPYLLNLLTFQEVEELFFNNRRASDNMMMVISLTNLILILGQLSEKICKNESILDEKEKLKELQIIIISHSTYISRLFNMNNLSSKYYQIINIFRDIDFCIKTYLLDQILIINNKKHNFLDELILCMNFTELRYCLYSMYPLHTNKNLITNQFKEEEINIINNTLTIKDFIVIGDKFFHEKIKTIESIIKSKSFKHLNIEEISNYLEQKIKEKGPTIKTYFYFLIISLDEYLKNFEIVYLLSKKTGITFLVFLYVENENKKIKKNVYNHYISSIFVYSLNDIVDYLSQNLYFENCLNSKEPEEKGNMINIKIPKISFEQNENDKYQDGCFELSETFDINIIRNKFVFSIGNNIDYLTEFYKYIYYIYKEHNALDIFFNQNCLYFGWTLYPELSSNSICFVKRFLYMYCREEKPSEKSFYRIINDDLRTRDPYKIYRYVNILALINQKILEEELISFKGKVYRATKLDEKLILQLVPGSKMVNTTFWSTSKEFKIVENFMIRNDWRNAFIICKAVKNNIDIDLEQISPYNEKEVLFLPFTEFIVEKISSEIKYGKKVYTIELTELENNNYVNTDNMQIENVKILGVSKDYENQLEGGRKIEEIKSIINNKIINPIFKNES